MSTTLTEKGAVGIVVHFLGALTIHESTTMGSTAKNVAFGDEMILLNHHIEALRDRHGDCQLLQLLDDESAQIKAWGSVRVRRGPWPSTDPFSRIEPGSPAFDEARVAALHAARLLPDDEARIAAAKVREKYGVESSARSRTMATYGTR